MSQHPSHVPAALPWPASASTASRLGGRAERQRGQRPVGEVVLLGRPHGLGPYAGPRVRQRRVEEDADSRTVRFGVAEQELLDHRVPLGLPALPQYGQDRSGLPAVPDGPPGPGIGGVEQRQQQRQLGGDGRPLRHPRRRGPPEVLQWKVRGVPEWPDGGFA
ncbi:hypothetical protein ACWGDE_21875 [Streptomyces sp. NPDC054956]